MEIWKDIRGYLFVICFFTFQIANRTQEEE